MPRQLRSHVLRCPYGREQRLTAALESRHRTAPDAIVGISSCLLERALFVWPDRADEPTAAELDRAASVVANRMTGAITSPARRRATLVLFLGGYFDSGYLGYEAAEGIDWVWEHRPDDFEKVGL